METNMQEKNKKRTIAILLFCCLTFPKITLAFLTKKEEQHYWILFKKLYIKNNYVNDNYFKNATHSEAQAIGLLLAVHFDDRETFKKLWRWTKQNLQTRKNDSLFAWLWGKDYNNNFTVLDYNNASDADIIIAWSLILAHEKWKNHQYLYEAQKIIKDIKKKLIIKYNNAYYLLPGSLGFIDQNKIIINPSYYIIPAFKKFYFIDKDKVWINLIQSLDQTIIKEILSRKRVFNLIPDWIIIKKNPCIKSQKEDIFGYEAIRFYLYQKTLKKSKSLSYFLNFLRSFYNNSWIPDKVDLKRNMVSVNDAPAGFYSVFSIITDDKKLKEQLLLKAKEKLKYEKNYYSISLFLLSHIINKYYSCTEN